MIDLHSRAVIGWAMDKRMKTSLVCDALSMALYRRNNPKNVIVHSDRGSQYCSHQYRQLIEKQELIGSMSRKGNCWDNAISESFFHTDLPHFLGPKQSRKTPPDCLSYSPIIV